MSSVWISKLGMSLFWKVPVLLSKFRQDKNRLSPFRSPRVAVSRPCRNLPLTGPYQCAKSNKWGTFVSICSVYYQSSTHGMLCRIEHVWDVKNEVIHYNNYKYMLQTMEIYSTLMILLKAGQLLEDKRLGNKSDPMKHWFSIMCWQLPVMTINRNGTICCHHDHMKFVQVWLDPALHYRTIFTWFWSPLGPWKMLKSEFALF